MRTFTLLLLHQYFVTFDYALHCIFRTSTFLLRLSMFYVVFYCVIEYRATVKLSYVYINKPHFKYVSLHTRGSSYSSVGIT